MTIKIYPTIRCHLQYRIVDLELFKPANDVYGHPFGDRVLRQLAALLQSRVRQ
ncbi:diguanylate cyclase [Craterilacuibacter sinensis]|uniref:Diguanylate cyclase n=1 Tax=Craterilacuibacter sinensis TaxID=2686017 RepID=A0A845BNB2_9NEIS|nr:diguanylate cyclase [Craterilacuibacter sinensis]